MPHNMPESPSREHRKETGKNKNASGSDTGGGTPMQQPSEPQKPGQLGQSSDRSNRDEN